MDGHVFVIHGDLTHLHADAVLIPCDISGEVGEHWGRFHVVGEAARTLSGELHDGPVSALRTAEDRQLYRYVDTGATRDTAEQEWLAERVGVGLRSLGSDLAGCGRKLTDRYRPLVALPMVGTGAGGFNMVRGEALTAILREANSAVRLGVDVAIVCWQRSDYVAIQQQREAQHWNWSEDSHLPQVAAELATQLQAGRLVLFFGAGVSRAAGLNDFAELVSELERSYGMYPPAGLDLPTRVQRLRGHRSAEQLKERVRHQLERNRYSMAHGLLASLRVRETLTTNFDQLYELAARRPFASEFDEALVQLDVHPWQRTSAARPWLLKAHGDAARSGDLVLSADEYAAFREKHGPVASVLQAMFALSREVLFVGYSLRDENIVSLMDQTSQYHDSYGVEHRRLGTVLDLETTGVVSGERLVRVGLRVGDEAVDGAAWRLEAFLDYLGWLACQEEASWLLDSRYAALLQSDEERTTARQLREIPLPSTRHWTSVRRRLREFGRQA